MVRTSLTFNKQSQRGQYVMGDSSVELVNYLTETELKLIAYIYDENCEPAIFLEDCCENYCDAC